MDNIYLSSSAMKATAHSLSLISNVTHFEIVELWTNYNHEGVRCVYVHATDKIMSIYPHIKPGHHPKRDITEHTISPGVSWRCQLDRYSIITSSKVLFQIDVNL